MKKDIRKNTGAFSDAALKWGGGSGGGVTTGHLAPPPPWNRILPSHRSGLPCGMTKHIISDCSMNPVPPSWG